MKKHYRRSLLAGMISLIILMPAQAQLNSREIDSLVEEAMEKFTVAGVAVGVVKDGKVVHAKG